ncbi:MAG: helix-turn-helix domain-containing protein [Gammaproteobacteria bacterium]
MSSKPTSNVVDIAHLRKSCRACSLRDLCLPLGLDSDDMERLESVVHSRGPIRPGEHLFREGDTFHAIYAVKTGALKTYNVDSQGREHVLGFHIPGELAGLDGIYPGKNRCNAVALQATSVCVLPFSRLEEVIHEVPGLQTQVLRLMSRELSASAQLATDHSADERLAGFLLNLSRRSERRGLSPRRLSLPMPRRDIASHLRLATETVSRLFARFQEEGLLTVRRRDVEIMDMETLERLGTAYDIDNGAGGARRPQST